MAIIKNHKIEATSEVSLKLTDRINLGRPMPHPHPMQNKQNSITNPNSPNTNSKTLEKYGSGIFKKLQNYSVEADIGPNLNKR